MADNMNTVYLGSPVDGEVVRTSISSTVFSDLSISGTADIGDLDATIVGSSISIAGATALGSTLSVRGASTFHNTIGSASNISGAQIAGSSGLFVGSVAIDGGSSNLSVDGTLAVGSTTSIRGNITAYGTAIFAGDVALDGAGSDLSVDGTAAIGSTLSVRGVPTFHGALNCESNVSIDGTIAGGSTLSITGNTNLHGTLTVDSTIGTDSAISGAAITATTGLFIDDVHLDGGTSDLSVDGAADVGSTLSVRGATTLYGGLTGTTAVFSSDVHCDGTSDLSVDGTTDIGSTLSVRGVVTTHAVVHSESNVSIDGTLGVLSTVSIRDNTDLYGTLTAHSTIGSASNLSCAEVDCTRLLSDGTIRIGEAPTAHAGGAAGTAGDMIWIEASGATWLYICCSTDSWARVALSPF